MTKQELTYILIGNPELDMKILVNLLKLKQPYREKAITNYIKTKGVSHFSDYITINNTEPFKSIEHSLGMAYRWIYTPEGYEYWYEIALNIENYVLEKVKQNV